MRFVKDVLYKGKINCAFCSVFNVYNLNCGLTSDTCALI